MAASGDKSSKFLEAIKKYAQEQRDKMHSEAEYLKQKEKEKVEDEVLAEACSLIKKEMSQMKSEISRNRSKQELEIRKELFKKREAITQEVFKAAEAKLLNSTKRKNYAESLQSSAKEISEKIDAEGTVIYVCSRDLKLADEIKTAFGKDCRVEVSNTIKIGGLKAMNKNCNLIIDDTLDSKLNDQYNWFYENSGLNIG